MLASIERLPIETPTRRRVGGRHELRGALGRGSESNIVEDSQILVNRSASGFLRKSFAPPVSPEGRTMTNSQASGLSVELQLSRTIEAAQMY